MSAEPNSLSPKDTTQIMASSATDATSLSNHGIMMKETATDKSVNWEANCLAYRHAIKDVVREPDPIKMREALAKLLSDDKIGTLGRDLHFIVKHAVRMVHFAEQSDAKQTREATEELFKKVKELEHNATVAGWVATS